MVPNRIQEQSAQILINESLASKIKQYVQSLTINRVKIFYNIVIINSLYTKIHNMKKSNSYSKYLTANTALYISKFIIYNQQFI